MRCVNLLSAARSVSLREHLIVRIFATKAGISDMTCRALRRTFATELQAFRIVERCTGTVATLEA